MLIFTAAPCDIDTLAVGALKFIIAARNFGTIDFVATLETVLFAITFPFTTKKKQNQNRQLEKSRMWRKMLTMNP